MSSESASTPAWRVIDQGGYGRGANAEPGTSTASRIELATTPAEYRRLWNEIVSAENEPPPADFPNEVVAFLTLGQKSTGGWAIEVSSVEVSGASAEVQTTISRPAPGGIVTMAFTAPYAVVAIAAPDVRQSSWVDQSGAEIGRGEKDPG
ncbi:MAG: protease complex subunit PrcB family protein [Acidobacteria bacterium]|nr:protease complex subunit PrcB family protein [Acidobacteriota bacterium]